MLPKGHYLILNTEKRQIESIKNPSASIVSCLNTCSRSSLQNQANQQQMMTNRTFPVKEGSSHFLTFFFSVQLLTTPPKGLLRTDLELFYLNSTLNFGIPIVFVFQLEVVYYKTDRLLTGLTAQQKGTTARWYSNKTSLF